MDQEGPRGLPEGAREMGLLSKMAQRTEGVGGLTVKLVLTRENSMCSRCGHTYYPLIAGRCRVCAEARIKELEAGINKNTNDPLDPPDPLRPGGWELIS